MAIQGSKESKRPGILMEELCFAHRCSFKALLPSACACVYTHAHTCKHSGLIWEWSLCARPDGTVVLKQKVFQAKVGN